MTADEALLRLAKLKEPLTPRELADLKKADPWGGLACQAVSDRLERSQKLVNAVARELASGANSEPRSALDTQEGGDHYKSLKIQPVEYIHANNIGYFEGCVIKYVTRWRAKNGLEDLRKAIHFIELLMELEAGEEEVRDCV